MGDRPYWVEARIKRSVRALCAQAKQLDAEQLAALDAELQRVRALQGRTLTLRGKKPFTGKLFWVGTAHSGKSVRIGVRSAQGVIKWTSSAQIEREQLSLDVD